MASYNPVFSSNSAYPLPDSAISWLLISGGLLVAGLFIVLIRATKGKQTQKKIIVPYFFIGIGLLGAIIGLIGLLK